MLEAFYDPSHHAFSYIKWRRYAIHNLEKTEVFADELRSIDSHNALR